MTQIQLYKTQFALFVLLFSIICLLPGCSMFKEQEAPEVGPHTLYNEAQDDLVKSNFKAAVEKFENVEREYPASKWAPEAQIKRAYAYYKAEKFNEAIMVAEDFVKQHPSHRSADYMYYLRGISYYDQIVDVGRDQHLTFKAIEALKEVIARFPHSKYARDAKLKIEFAHNNLAGKEMNIGHFYLKKDKLVAALGRFKNVVENYQTTIFTPEALYRLVEIYYTLGAITESQKYAAVLGHNYPDNKWYKKAYQLLVDSSYEKQPPWYKKPLKEIW